MHIIKSLLRGSLGIIFKFSLLFVLILLPVVLVFGTSAQLKQSLRGSKIYNVAVDGLIDSVKKDAEKQQNPGQKDEDPFAEAAVQDALKKAVTPAFIQSSSEQIIDGVYGWLQGKTDQPQFSIDISGVKQNFINAVGDYAVNRAKTLPVCTPAQARQALADGKVEPLTATCLPAGYNVEDLRAEITKQLNTPKEGEKDNLLNYSSLSPDSFPKDESGKTPIQSLTEDMNRAPEIFHWIAIAPYLLLGIAVVSGGLLVLLYDDKRRGVRNLALTMLPLGVLGLLGVFGTKTAFAQLEKSDALVKADANFKQPLIDLAHSLSGAVNQRLLLLAGLYVVLGGGTLLVLHFTKPKNPAEPIHEPSPELPEPVEHTPAKPAEAKANKSAKPKKTLIQ